MRNFLAYSLCISGNMFSWRKLYTSKIKFGKEDSFRTTFSGYYVPRVLWEIYSRSESHTWTVEFGKEDSFRTILMLEILYPQSISGNILFWQEFKLRRNNRSVYNSKKIIAKRERKMCNFENLCVEFSPLLENILKTLVRET